MQNILTIDIEEWYHPTLKGLRKYLQKNNAPQSRIVNQAEKLLKILDKTNAHATFFILGEVAENHPQLVHEISQRGHEVASHGYRHELVYHLKKDDFREDVKRSVALLENLTNQKVIGYRAPLWSLHKKRTPWAWDVIHSLGLKYDSSIYPFKTWLFGDNTENRFVNHIAVAQNATITEIPAPAMEFLQVRVPFAGGFFFRLLPAAYIKWCMNRYNSKGHPAIICIHPWELDHHLPRLEMGISDKILLYYHLDKTEKKLTSLLNNYSFTSIKTYFNW